MRRHTRSASSRVLTRGRVGAMVLAVALLLPSAGTVHAAPSGNTHGCAAVTAQFESGNPGIATASSTPFGYGPCGTGTPGGPR